MSIGKQFLSAAIAEGSVYEFLHYGSIDHVFKANEVEAYSYVKEFVKQYGKLPGEETILAHTGEALVKHKEPAAYYFDLLQLRHVELTIKKAMKSASDLLLPENKDPQASLEILTSAVMDLAIKKNQKQIVDFRDAYDTIMPTYVEQFHAQEGIGLMLGWPTFDKMSGGVRKGDMVNIAGRPARGKTFQMLYTSHYGWNVAAKANLILKAAAAGSDVQASQVPYQSRMFVSMEMDPLAIQQRLAAMHAKIGLTKLKHAELSSFGLKTLKKGLMEIKGFGAPFWVVSGNLTSTVEDIYMLARQLQPDGLHIDGGYLVKHPTEKDRFRRVAENVELMKTELAPLCPLVASWQFAKSASKKKKGEKVDGDDVGYSDAIYQISSILLALIEPDSVETINQKKIDILKGRNGEIGHFNTNWDFDSMDFSEIMEEDVSDLSFL